MAKQIRNLNGQSVQDGSILENIIYNDAAGSRKSTSVGAHLLPLPDGASGYTTNASSAALILPAMGKNLAIYNNDTVVHSITLGEDNTVTAQAAGAIQASTQHVGIPCIPNAWTYVACGVQNWIITDSNKLLVFLIDDNTYIRQEATK